MHGTLVYSAIKNKGCRAWLAPLREVHLVAGMASAAMISAAVSFLMMVVVITMYIRIIAKFSCK